MTELSRRFRNEPAGMEYAVVADPEGSGGFRLAVWYTRMEGEPDLVQERQWSTPLSAVRHLRRCSLREGPFFKSSP